MIIRLTTIADAPAIREIYRPSIEGSVISFEAVVPTVDEMESRIANCLPRYPWIICEDEHGACGYAYAGPHHPRAAYRWTANVSVYVASRVHRQGVARRLYRALFAILEKQGVRTLIAGITVPNPASHGFHQSLGFERAALFTKVGYKLGQWLDVGWWQLPLGDATEEEPEEFVPFAELRDSLPDDLALLA